MENKNLIYSDIQKMMYFGLILDSMHKSMNIFFEQIDKDWKNEKIKILFDYKFKDEYFDKEMGYIAYDDTTQRNQIRNKLCYLLLRIKSAKYKIENKTFLTEDFCGSEIDDSLFISLFNFGSDCLNLSPILNNSYLYKNNFNWNIITGYKILQIKIVDRDLYNKIQKNTYSPKEFNKFNNSFVGILLPLPFTVLNVKYNDKIIYTDFLIPFDLNFVTYKSNLDAHKKTTFEFKPILDGNIPLTFKSSAAAYNANMFLSRTSAYNIIHSKQDSNKIINTINNEIRYNLLKHMHLFNKIFKLTNAKFNNLYEKEKYNCDILDSKNNLIQI